MVTPRFASAFVAVVAALSAVAAAPPAGAVVGGSTAAQGQYPWLVSLQYRGVSGWYHTCGGAILDADTILTAAHCVHGRETPSNFRVRWGFLDQNNPPPGDDIAVSKIKKHESYSPETIDNDIAVLKLASPIPLGPAAKPIALPPQGLDPAGQVRVAGWGHTTWQGSSPRDQLQLALPVVDRATCQAQYQGVNTITRGMMCAGSHGKGTCQGDSGGALVQDQAGQPTAVGVVSYGVQCAGPRFASVYANTGHYRQWIDNARNALAGRAAPHDARTTDAEPAAPPVGSDHGCPFESVCLYKTAAHYRNGRPDAIDDLALQTNDRVYTVPAGGYAEVVNNTRPGPLYSSQGIITPSALGTCAYLPKNTEPPGTDTATAPLPVNAIVVGTTPATADALTVPCPENA